jgi:hypothetical protein
MKGVNIFGLTTNSTPISQLRGPPGIGFQYLDDRQNFNLNNKRLANVADPLDNQDATTKNYVEDSLENLKLYLREFVKSKHIVINENNQNKYETLRKYFEDATTQLQDEINDLKPLIQQLNEIDTDLRSNFEKHVSLSDEKIEFIRSGVMVHVDFLTEEIKKIKEQELPSISLELANLKRVFQNFNEYVEDFRKNLHIQDRETVVNSSHIEDIKVLLQKYRDDHSALLERVELLESTLRKENVESVN